MMPRRPGALIILAAALAGSVPSAAQDAAQKDLAEGLSAASAGAELFLRAYEVFSHPRCSNCHPRDDRPRWGPTGQVHGMNVQRGEDHSDDPRGPAGGYGRIGMQCKTCHQKTNGELLNSPPGAGKQKPTGELLTWRLAPRKMGWAGLTATELCMQLNSLVPGGGREGIDAVIEHIVKPEKLDPLVAWAWDPGPGREPAPGTLDQFVQVLKWWKDRDAVCPSM
jgi:hypothetical protein